MQLVDIGANLTHESFSSDFDSVIHSAKEAGVAHILVTGTDLQSSSDAWQLSQQDPAFYSSTAGFHPHVASKCSDEDFAKLSQLAARSSVVAVGETGLDFNRNFSPAEAQRSCFIRHLQLAEELQKPVFLHQRDAHEEFLQILKRHRDKLPGGVVHCFTDSEQALKDYLELDMYIGITGWVCDERRGLALQQLVPLIPADRLLVETDSPYLLPRTIQPKPKSRRNEPKYLPEVLSTLAQLTGRPEQLLAEQTAANAACLFGLTL